MLLMHIVTTVRGGLYIRPCMVFGNAWEIGNVCRLVCVMIRDAGMVGYG